MAFLSKYGEARVIYVPVIKRAVVDFAVGADWTPAAGDVKISKDGGAAANVTNLPTAIAMGNTAMWSFSLTATEMQAALVLVTVADAATKAVEDTMFAVETYGNASAQHAFDLDTAAVTVATGGIAATAFAAGAIDAAAIAAGAITSSEAPNLDAAISTRATPAQVNAEVLDVLNVDTFAEPGQEAPPATTTLVKKIGYLYKLLRNKITQDATTLKIFADDAVTVDQKATVSDDGTTYTRGEIATGP